MGVFAYSTVGISLPILWVFLPTIPENPFGVSQKGTQPLTGAPSLKSEGPDARVPRWAGSA